MAPGSLTSARHDFYHGNQSDQTGKISDLKNQISLKTDCDVASPPPTIPRPSAIHSPLQSESQRVLNRLLIRLKQEDPIGRDYIEEYLVLLYRRNLRPNTFICYYTAILLFFSYLKQSDKKNIEEITRNDLGGFVEHEQDRGLKPTSVRNRLKSMYAFLDFLIERGIVDPDVTKRRMSIKLPDTLPRAIDPDDIKKLLSVVKHTRNRAMILTLLRTGMRIGELLETKVIDLNLKEKRIEIFEARKNRVGRIVYLSDDAMTALRAWLETRDKHKEYVFYGQGRKTKLSYTAARNIFTKYLKKAQMADKGYSLHCLRHTFASELLNAGMRLECLQQLLGHATIEMTRRYARLTDNTRREEYFKAMSIIESGEINGHYRFDPAIPQIYEEKELLCAHCQKLHEHP